MSNSEEPLSFSSFGEIARTLVPVQVVDTQLVPVVKALPFKAEATCPTCHVPFGEMSYGWVKDYTLHTNHEGHHQKWDYCEIPCPTCSGDVVKRKEAKRQAEQVAHLFGKSQIPFHARNWTFVTYPTDADQQAKKAVQVYVQQMLTDHPTCKRGLWLGGAAGHAKTGLSISAMKEAMARQQGTLFVLTIELMNRLRATMQRQSEETQDELLKAATETNFVVFDDIATERPTPYVLEQFYYIVEKRRSYGLWTIFTSNLSTADLEAYWRPEHLAPGAFYPGLRVIERIRDYCTGIAVQGRNQREKGW